MNPRSMTQADRVRLREKYGNACQICGATEELQLHHDDYSQEPTRLLCRSCHKKEHHKPGAAKPHFTVIRAYPRSVPRLRALLPGGTKDDAERLEQLMDAYELLLAEVGKQPVWVPTLRKEQE